MNDVGISGDGIEFTEVNESDSIGKAPTFDDIPLYDLGNHITIGGVVLQGQGKTYALMMPLTENQYPKTIRMTLEEWERFLHQVDYLEAQLFPNSTDPKIAKAIVRKSQRNIEAQIQWNVFRRDKYTCRYCGIDDVPLTVDHIVLWEDLGQSLAPNLITACRKCNKMRGNTPFLDWLKSDYYSRMMEKWLGNNWMISTEHYQNEKAWDDAIKLPKRSQQRSR